MERATTSMVHAAVGALAMASLGTWAVHIDQLPATAGLASGLLLALAALPLMSRIPPAAYLAVGAATLALGLYLAWVTSNPPDIHAVRVVQDVGWTVAILGGWIVYTNAVGMMAVRRRAEVFDDAARASWRAGDAAYALRLSRSIVVRAQPHWAALVLETAWPEPRPRVVKDLLASPASLGRDELVEIRATLRDKDGEDFVGARWELARLACDVIAEASSRESDETGGPATARFIVAAARVVRDDEEAARVFAALILPAIARRA